MVKNNLENDVKVKCLEAGMTQMQLGENQFDWSVCKSNYKEKRMVL